MRNGTRICWAAAAIAAAVCLPGRAHATLSGPERNERGAHFSLGFGGTRLDLQDDAYGGLAGAGIDLARDGAGIELVGGYRFGPNLSLDLRVAGSEHDTGRQDLTAWFATGMLEVKAHVRPGERVQPFFAGGLGGGNIVLEDANGDEHTLEGGAISAGTGVDFLLGRHWTLGFSYRATVLDYENTTVRLPGQAPFNFHGSGMAHRFGFRWDVRI